MNIRLDYQCDHLPEIGPKFSLILLKPKKCPKTFKENTEISPYLKRSRDDEDEDKK